jgi:hypothetical protein
LIVNYEMNLLSLVSPWLDNNYPIQTKMLQYRISLSLPSKPGPEIRLLWFFLRGFSCSNSVATLSRHLYPAAVLEIHAWRSSCRFWSLGPWPMDMEGDVCYGSCDYEAPAFVFLASSAPAGFGNGKEIALVSLGSGRQRRAPFPVLAILFPRSAAAGNHLCGRGALGVNPMRDETWQRTRSLPSQPKIFSLTYITSNLSTYAWSIKHR